MSLEGDNEELELESTLTPEEEAAEDAAFAAGFNQTRGDDIAHGDSTTAGAGTQPQPKPDDQDDANDAAARAAAEADAQARAEEEERARAEAERNAPVTLTKAELDALRAAAGKVGELETQLRRTNDSFAGRFGNIQQTIEQIKAQAAQGIRPSIKQLKRIGEEFPEMAQLLAEDLNEAFGTPTPGEQGAPASDGTASGAQAPGANPTDPNPAPTPAPTADPFANPAVQQRLRETEMAVVDAAHPDWREQKATPEFKQWFATLPDTAKNLLSSTWDSKVMVPAFKDFKAWKAKQAEAATAAQQRGKRLERGIPATTGRPTGGHAVSEDDAFEAGFKKARGGS